MNITNISHSFDAFKLSIDTLNLKKGNIYALVGENGAGKTTLMKVLSGELKPNLQFEYRDYAFQDVLFIPSDLEAYTFLTVAEFVTLLYTYSDRKAKVNEVIKKIGLVDKQDDVIASLSEGMRKKLVLAPIFLNEYEILMLDEPFNSIDLKYIHQLKIILKNEVSDKIMIISSHILDSLKDLSDVYLYLKDGELNAVLNTAAELEAIIFA